MLSTSARIRVRTSSFLQAATRHKSEAKPRSIQGASRTSYRPDTLSRLHTNIEMHDWRSMSRSLTRASRAPQARCRQSILRRRRPRTCGRRCRAPRSWPPSELVIIHWSLVQPQLSIQRWGGSHRVSLDTRFAKKTIPVDVRKDIHGASRTAPVESFGQATGEHCNPASTLQGGM